MSDDEKLPVVMPVDEFPADTQPEGTQPAEDEPVTVVVEPASHGEAAQRAANKMPHSERTVNGGKRL